MRERESGRAEDAETEKAEGERVTEGQWDEDKSDFDKRRCKEGEDSQEDRANRWAFC
jgi:hypothetical protein